MINRIWEEQNFIALLQGCKPSHWWLLDCSWLTCSLVQGIKIPKVYMALNFSQGRLLITPPPTITACIADAESKVANLLTRLLELRQDTCTCFQLYTRMTASYHCHVCDQQSYGQRLDVITHQISYTFLFPHVKIAEMSNTAMYSFTSLTSHLFHSTSFPCDPSTLAKNSSFRCPSCSP